MESSILSTKFAAGLDYDAYVHSGTEEQTRRWQQVYDVAKLTAAQTQLIMSFTRQMNVLVVTGIWCGDCVQQLPFLQRIAEPNLEKIAIKYVDRDVHKDLSSQLRINGGDRVPVVLFLSEDFELCATLGDRTLSRYRAIAQRSLGAACETGLLIPPSDEMSATLQDWLNEFERIQLLLRLSPRLRKRHND
jgi:thiol-disulfide isomerase/thioredoxin